MYLTSLHTVMIITKTMNPSITANSKLCFMDSLSHTKFSHSCDQIHGLVHPFNKQSLYETAECCLTHLLQGTESFLRS